MSGHDVRCIRRSEVLAGERLHVGVYIALAESRESPDLHRLNLPDTYELVHAGTTNLQTMYDVGNGQ